VRRERHLSQHGNAVLRVVNEVVVVDLFGLRVVEDISTPAAEPEPERKRKCGCRLLSGDVSLWALLVCLMCVTRRRDQAMSGRREW
jgi:hypothetical protein